MVVIDSNNSYASNEDIGNIIYHGETFPGDNTMNTSRAVSVKKLIDGKINKPIKMANTSHVTNHVNFPIFYDVFIRLFQAYVDEDYENLKLTEDEEQDIVRANGGIALVCSRPDEDFEEPDSV